MKKNKQLIIFTETKKSANTDKLYIMELLEYYFDIDGIVIRFEYLEGKGNYKKRIVGDKIKFYRNNFSGETIIFYMIDKDDFDLNHQIKNKNNEIKEFCKQNNYELVWFVKNIEEVFIGEKVNDSNKTKTAKAFVKKRKISNIIVNNLCINEPKTSKKSNIIIVLKKHLTTKK